MEDGSLNVHGFAASGLFQTGPGSELAAVLALSGAARQPRNIGTTGQTVETRQL